MKYLVARGLAGEPERAFWVALQVFEKLPEFAKITNPIGAGAKRGQNPAQEPADRASEAAATMKKFPTWTGNIT